MPLTIRKWSARTHDDSLLGPKLIFRLQPPSQRHLEPERSQYHPTRPVGRQSIFLYQITSTQTSDIHGIELASTGFERGTQLVVLPFRQTHVDLEREFQA